MSRQQIAELCAQVWAAAFCSFALRCEVSVAKGCADKVVEDFLKQFDLR